ncbi:MAG TPA: AraC family transcriptional regulator ligand-binding domain-containing protein, partial [Pseudonocardia sp.]|nr:AraC family transcriptional regulator ligand-binding domain-containing protein [Pseudonocardia sp.]
AGLPEGLLSAGPAPLSPLDYFALWRAIEEESADELLPIRIGRAFSAEVFDAPLFAALCSPNLNVAAARLTVHKRLIGPMRMTVEHAAAETAVRYHWPEPLRPPNVLVAAELLFWVALARIATRSEVRPLRVGMPEPPAATEEYRAFLGVPIERTPEQLIVFSASDAARPFLTANEPMWRFFEPELRRRLAELTDGATTTERVRAALLEMLPAGTATIQAVARELTVSTRTLQRRLRAESTTFQALLGATREALARHYLRTGGMPATEIAFLLGYEDTNSFYRAFHSWTGETPHRVRTSSG